MSLDPSLISPALQDFLVERHLATLTTLRRDGSPHVVPVGFTWDADALVARVITSRGSAKARHLGRGGPAVLCQVERRRWVSLEGAARVVEDAGAVRDAEERYALRYHPPRPNPQRVVLEVTVTRVLADSTLR